MTVRSLGSSREYLIQIQDQLSCPLCTNLFDEPNSLPCGHSFCRVCVERSLFRENTCPTCGNYSMPKDIRKSMLLISIVSAFIKVRDSYLLERNLLTVRLDEKALSESGASVEEEHNHRTKSNAGIDDLVARCLPEPITVDDTKQHSSAVSNSTKQRGTIDIQEEQSNPADAKKLERVREGSDHESNSNCEPDDQQNHMVQPVDTKDMEELVKDSYLDAGIGTVNRGPVLKKMLTEGIQGVMLDRHRALDHSSDDDEEEEEEEVEEVDTHTGKHISSSSCSPARGTIQDANSDVGESLDLVAGSDGNESCSLSYDYVDSCPPPVNDDREIVHDTYEDVMDDYSQVLSRQKAQRPRESATLARVLADNAAAPSTVDNKLPSSSSSANIPTPTRTARAKGEGENSMTRSDTAAESSTLSVDGRDPGAADGSMQESIPADADRHQTIIIHDTYRMESYNQFYLSEDDDNNAADDDTHNDSNDDDNNTNDSNNEKPHDGRVTQGYSLEVKQQSALANAADCDSKMELQPSAFDESVNDTHSDTTCTSTCTTKLGIIANIGVTNNPHNFTAVIDIPSPVHNAASVQSARSIVNDSIVVNGRAAGSCIAAEADDEETQWQLDVDLSNACNGTKQNSSPQEEAVGVRVGGHNANGSNSNNSTNNFNIGSTASNHRENGSNSHSFTGSSNRNTKINAYDDDATVASSTYTEATMSPSPVSPSPPGAAGIGIPAAGPAISFINSSSVPVPTSAIIATETLNATADFRTASPVDANAVKFPNAGCEGDLASVNSASASRSASRSTSASASASCSAVKESAGEDAQGNGLLCSLANKGSPTSSGNSKGSSGEHGENGNQPFENSRTTPKLNEQLSRCDSSANCGMKSASESTNSSNESRVRESSGSSSSSRSSRNESVSIRDNSSTPYSVGETQASSQNQSPSPADPPSAPVPAPVPTQPYYYPGALKTIDNFIMRQQNSLAPPAFINNNSSADLGLDIRATGSRSLGSTIQDPHPQEQQQLKANTNTNKSGMSDHSINTNIGATNTNIDICGGRRATPYGTAVAAGQENAPSLLTVKPQSAVLVSSMPTAAASTTRTVATNSNNELQSSQYSMGSDISCDALAAHMRKRKQDIEEVLARKRMS